MKLTHTDLPEQKPMVIVLVSEACAVPLVGKVICHSLIVNKALRPKVLFRATCKAHIKLGPAVQSVVSLTSSLRIILLTVLADTIYNILVFFAEKM